MGRKDQKYGFESKNTQTDFLVILPSSLHLPSSDLPTNPLMGDSVLPFNCQAPASWVGAGQVFPSFPC